MKYLDGFGRHPKLFLVLTAFLLLKCLVLTLLLFNKVDFGDLCNLVPHLLIPIVLFQRYLVSCSLNTLSIQVLFKIFLNFELLFSKRKYLKIYFRINIILYKMLKFCN